MAGRCRDTSQSAGIVADARGVELADGEVSVDVRVAGGHERARIFVYARAQEEGRRGYHLLWDPALGLAEIRKAQDGRPSVALVSRGDLPVVPPDRWTRVTLVLDGPRLWARLDGQTILAASDDEVDAGVIALGLTRLGSLASEDEVATTWRDLQVAPLAGGPVARSPRVDPSLLPGHTIARPAPLDVVVRDEMRTAGLFWPRRCTVGSNDGAYEADGLRLRVTGRCFGVSQGASMDVLQPDVTIGDGEARIELRVDQGWDRAIVGLAFRNPVGGAPSLAATVFPATGTIRLAAQSAEDVKVLAMGNLGDAPLRPDSWISFAVQRLGDRAWLSVNDTPVLAADGVPADAGAPVVFVIRAGSSDDDAEVAVAFREFTASTVAGGDPGHGIVRAPRPVVDERYERILAFIRSDLVDDPGADAAAAERRAIGHAILDMIAESNVNLEVASLPEASSARFQVFRRSMQVDERFMTYTPHIATMFLLHELAHAHQERVGHPRACFDREVDSIKWQNRLWRAWFGPDGKQPPGDPIEATFTARVRLEREGRLEQLVQEVYREQCAGM